MTEENTTDLVIYKDYRTQVKEFKKTNDELVFDYESKKGNKDARSHIAKMKKVKTAVEKKRIAAAKEYREQCNDQSDEIQSEIDKMIAVHQKPLDEFAKREETRIAAIKKKIDDIFQRDAGTTSEEIQTELDYVNSIDLNDDFWEEFLGEAITAVADRVQFLHERMEKQVQYEEDQAELKRFRETEAKRKANEEALDKIKRENSEEGFEYQCDIEEDSKTPGVGEIYIDPGSEERVIEEIKEKISELTDKNSDPDSGIVFIPADKGSIASTVKQKRLEAEEDLISLGIDKITASMLVRKISFSSVRHIKFEL